jgi:hypothetical protein
MTVKDFIQKLEALNQDAQLKFEFMDNRDKSGSPMSNSLRFDGVYNESEDGTGAFVVRVTNKPDQSPPIWAS